MQRRIKVFIDTNIILTGTFFSGQETILLRVTDIDLFTADVCLEEARKVTARSMFGEDTETALEKLENTFVAFNIVNESDYSHLLPHASLLIPKKKNDQKVLAAALFTKPDFFLSRDSDFDKKNIRRILNLKTANEVLQELGVV